MPTWPNIALLTGLMSDPPDITELRRELLLRVEAHPIRTWSANLLVTIIAVLDLVGPELPPEPGERVRLRVVR